MSPSTLTRGICTALFLLVIAPAHPSGAQGARTAPRTPGEKESYSIGYQVGQSMVADGVEVDLDRFLQGLRDASEGAEPLLGEAEMNRLIVDLRTRSQEARLRAYQELVVANARRSEEFLAQNALREDVRTTESGLQYIVLRRGSGDPPGPGDTVKVHYRGTFPDGEEFDSSYARGEPQTFRTDGVIDGWTEALQLMEPGARWKVFVPPDLAYGRRGMGQRIPPNQALVFEIELISVQPQEGGD